MEWSALSIQLFWLCGVGGFIYLFIYFSFILSFIIIIIIIPFLSFAFELDGEGRGIDREIDNDVSLYLQLVETCRTLERNSFMSPRCCCTIGTHTTIHDDHFSATIEIWLGFYVFQMYSAKYSKAQSCAYFCSKNVLVALNTLYIVSTRRRISYLCSSESSRA